MSMEKPYVPSSEEAKKAEGMMSEEEKKMSEERRATFNEGRRRGAMEESERIERKNKFVEFSNVLKEISPGIFIDIELEDGKKITAPFQRLTKDGLGFLYPTEDFDYPLVWANPDKLKPHFIDDLLKIKNINIKKFPNLQKPLAK